MKLESKFSLDFKEKSDIYYRLLLEEDFDFKTKNINIKIELKENLVLVFIYTSSILDLKIGTSALIKSLEIIEKTLNI